MTAVLIQAKERWNPTGVVAQKGVTYRFDVAADARWKDSFIECGPDGFRNLIDPFGWLLRVKKVGARKARYFTLIGAIGQDEARAFIIGQGCACTAQADGEFYCFANDAPFAYWNNSGAISISITQPPQNT